VNSYTQTISVEKYKQFLNCLYTVSNYIEDLDIKQGLIRQRTADKQICVEMNLSSIFKQDLCVADIKSKLELMELLIDDGTDDITIQQADKVWFVYSKKTVFKFSWASASRLSTSFIEDDVFANFTKNTDQGKFLFEIDLNERCDLHKKMKKVCEKFNSDKIVVSIDDKAIAMTIESEDKRNTGVVYKTQNTTNLEKQCIIARSSFIEKIDAKYLKKIVFYSYVADNPTMSLSKATCDVETLPMSLYAVCKHSK